MLRVLERSLFSLFLLAMTDIIIIIDGEEVNQGIDLNGCITSTGQVWCSSLNKCVQQDYFISDQASDSMDDHNCITDIEIWCSAAKSSKGVPRTSCLNFNSSQLVSCIIVSYH